jgi:hypothetical protein
MKKMTLFFGVAIFLYACKKDHVGTPLIPSVKMIYKNLSDSAVVFGRSASFDLDGNGEKDILFNTMLVGDPISQKDKKQWLVISSFNTNLPVNINENIPVLNLNDSIPYPCNIFSGIPNWAGMSFKFAGNHFNCVELSYPFTGLTVNQIKWLRFSI